MSAKLNDRRLGADPPRNVLGRTESYVVIIREKVVKMGYGLFITAINVGNS